jgi:hypothetical protein
MRKLLPNRLFTTAALAGLLTVFLAESGCVTAYKESVNANESEVFVKIYKTDFNTAWQAVLDALKNSSLDVSNREGGFLQTKWTDNTEEKNFAEGLNTTDGFLKAQYRFKVTVSKGAAFNGIPTTKVSVQKEQLVQRDVLEGWTPTQTDSIEENTLLYRIGRIISIRTKMARLEEKKINEETANPGL